VTVGVDRIYKIFQDVQIDPVNPEKNLVDPVYGFFINAGTPFAKSLKTACICSE